MNDSNIAIEKMAFGGSGVGYDKGKVCFVPYTAPGDTVNVKVRTEKRSYLQAEMIELLEPSPLRVKPHCPIFGTCGGCNWQHLSYPTQLQEKQKIFTDILWRSGRVDAARIAPIISAPQPYGYRARVQLKVHTAAGEPLIGFYRSGSHHVVNIPGNCAIAHATINCLLPELQRLLRLFPERDRIPQIDVTVGEDNTASVIIHYIGTNHAETVVFLHKNRSCLASASGISMQSGRKMTLRHIVGPDVLSYRIPQDFMPGSPERLLAFTPGGFSQVNYHQNLALIAKVHEWAELTGKERVLDIFCGNGNLSIPLAGHCGTILGIEEYAPSISDACRNSQINDLTNAEYRCSDAVAGLRELVARGDWFDIVILDPPRTGAAEIVKLLPTLKPSKIIYISCDPPTLARDIGILKRLDYEAVKCVPIDMFPQTFHIESVTLLEPSASKMAS